MLVGIANAYPRRYEDENSFNELCLNKSPNEYFRLSENNDCREVFQCSELGLIPLRCPSGLGKLDIL